MLLNGELPAFNVWKWDYLSRGWFLRHWFLLSAADFFLRYGMLDVEDMSSQHCRAIKERNGDEMNVVGRRAGEREGAQGTTKTYIVSTRHGT